MQKLLPALILSTFAAFALYARAATHAAAAPTKASAPAADPAEKRASEPA